MKKKKIFLYLLFFLITICLLFIFKDNIIIFLDSTRISFRRTIIDENRYILLLNGLKNTLIISIFSILFGTILGILLFFIQRLNNNMIKVLTNILIRFLQGIPITVILLIFYFVLFGNININPIIVSIMAFSIYFSAYIAEITKGAYQSINRIQIDSAYSLGFNKIKTIKYIVIPQVLGVVIPVYKNEVVSLIKLTSIAGYISIIELTKASDIIRSRTYEAFFPLIFTALIYFLICYIIGKIFDLLYKKINPRAVKKKWKAPKY